MKTKLNSLLILFFAILSFIPQDKLPEAPLGYAWKSLDAIKGKVLVPDNWFFNAEHKGDTYAYFITKEDYTKDPNGMFETGLSINVFTNMGNNNAVDYANSFVEQITKDNEVVFMKDHEFSNFKGKMIRIKKGAQYIHYVVVGNTKTNKLYLTYFESSKTAWADNKKFGETIMENLAFDPNF